jgi:hypothetical protein
MITHKASIIHLKLGDFFTVVGVRVKRDGHFTKQCKPGRETVWQVTKTGMRHYAN